MEATLEITAGAVMRLLFAVVALSVSAESIASPITFDFSGTLSAYSTAADSSTYTDSLAALSDKHVSGSITFDFDLITSGFSATTPGLLGSSIYRQGSGEGTMVLATIDWANGTFTPAAVAPNTGSDSIVGVNLADDLQQDSISIADTFDTSQGGVQYRQQIGLNFDGSLFANDSDLIPTFAEISNTDLVSAPNIFGTVLNDSYRADPANPNNPTQVLFTGYQGTFQINSISLRPTSVPEPATLALLSLGLLGLGFARRSRARLS